MAWKRRAGGAGIQRARAVRDVARQPSSPRADGGRRRGDRRTCGEPLRRVGASAVTARGAGPAYGAAAHA
ncbi:MAG TPA: hypothetical protein VGA78_16255, partial [Gemmatimonadales bacterium]